MEERIPKRLDLVSEEWAGRYLGLTLEELKLIDLQPLLIGSEPRYPRAEVEAFKLNVYWRAGKAHREGARKRVPDPIARGKLASATLRKPEEAALALTVSVDVLKDICRKGEIGHLDYGNGVYRFLGVDLECYVERLRRRIPEKRPTCSTVPVPAPVPTPCAPPPTPLQHRPPAVPVRKIQPNSAVAKPPAVTTASASSVAPIREVLPVEITPPVQVQSPSPKFPVVPSVLKYDPPISSDTVPAPDDDDDDDRDVGYAGTPVLEALHGLLGLADTAS